MKKCTMYILLSLLLLALFACDSEEPEDELRVGIDATPPPATETQPDGSEPQTPEPEPVDPEGGLNRNAEGILVGSAVLDEPVLLMGMGVDPVVVINVRDGPSIEAKKLTTIGRGEVVEATEITDGWYAVTVFASMTEGYIRSDLLVPYEAPDADTGYIDDTGGGNQFSGIDPSGLNRGSDGILIGSTAFDSPMMLMGMGSSDLVVINVREAPSIDAGRVRSEWGSVTIGKGQRVEAFAVEDGWYRVRIYPGMFEGYIRSDLLVPFDDTQNYYASNLFNFDTKMSPTQQLIAPGPLVDLRTMIPDIEYCLVFATPENFTGKTQYSRDIPLLQLGTAEKLKAAQELFRQDGYSIKLYDAYRPSSVSGRLSNIISDRRYIARAGTSIHNRGAAVDITLVDSNGNELEMPSPMHTFNSTAHRDSSSMSAAAKENMDYMTNIMRQAGLSATINSEWWHFGDSEAGNYLPIDIEFRDLPITAFN